MSLSGVALLTSIIVSATASNTPSAEPKWAGEYPDKKFLDGQAVFQMSIEESGNAIQVSFDAAYNDAHGAAPDGQGPGRITTKDALEFKWKDSFKNSGTGRITRAGEDIIVSMKDDASSRFTLPRILRAEDAAQAREAMIGEIIVLR